MSNILFLTSVFSHKNKGHLNTDLVDEFLENGHNVDVIKPIERKYNTDTHMENLGKLRVVEFKCLNYRGKCNLIEKGLSTLLLAIQFRFVVSKLKDRKYDLIMYTTLPITYGMAVEYIKGRDGAFAYLLQKDFFPQSAVDMGLIKKGSITYKIFRCFEKHLFRVSDKIGVISPKNVEFYIDHNQEMDSSKVEVCTNSIKPTELSIIRKLQDRRSYIRRKNDIPDDKLVFIYGGNLSRAQGARFIYNLIEPFSHLDDVYWVFAGNGNEYNLIESHVNDLGVKNIKMVHYIPQKEYIELLSACDVGLVFLDYKFTIANIPSRMLNYADLGKPILAATDEYTDCKDIIIENEMGLWSSSDDVGKFISNVKYMSEHRDKIKIMGENSRRFLKTNWNVRNTYLQIIENI